MITTEQTECLVIRRAAFQMFGEGSLHKKELQERVEFLKRCVEIQQAVESGEASSQDIAVMAQSLKRIELGPNQAVCQQGGVADQVIFVRSGQLLQVRAIDANARLDKPPDDTSKPPTPVRTNKRDSAVAVQDPLPGKKKKLVQVGRLKVGMAYGFAEISKGDRWPFSLVSELVAEVYAIGKQEIMKKMPKKMLTSVTESCKDMQLSDAHLMKLLHQTCRWDQYKESIKTQVMSTNRDSMREATEEFDRSGLRAQGLTSESRREMVDMITSLGASVSQVAKLELRNAGSWSGLQEKDMVLSMREEEFYSDYSAQKLKIMTELKVDPVLQVALRHAGCFSDSQRVQNAAACPPTALELGETGLQQYSPGGKSREDSWDPSLFLVKHWALLSKDHLGLSEIDTTVVEKISQPQEEMQTSRSERQSKPETESGKLPLLTPRAKQAQPATARRQQVLGSRVRLAHNWGLVGDGSRSRAVHAPFSSSTRKLGVSGSRSRLSSPSPEPAEGWMPLTQKVTIKDGHWTSDRGICPTLPAISPRGNILK